MVTVACNAAGDEIFPSQAERVQLFGYRVAIIATAVLIAVVCTQSISGDADNSPDRCCAQEFEANLAKTCITTQNGTNTIYTIDNEFKASVSTSLIFVIVITIIGLVGLFSIKPMMLAKQPTNRQSSKDNDGIFSNLHEFIYWKPFVYLFFANLFDTFAGQMLTAIAPFFMTYFLWLERDEFVSVFTIVVVIGMFVQFASIALCSWYFGTSSKSS